jgi:hypothetical protein
MPLKKPDCRFERVGVEEDRRADWWSVTAAVSSPFSPRHDGEETEGEPRMTILAWSNEQLHIPLNSLFTPVKKSTPWSEKLN